MHGGGGAKSIFCVCPSSFCETPPSDGDTELCDFFESFVTPAVGCPLRLVHGPLHDSNCLASDAVRWHAIKSFAKSNFEGKW